MPEKPEYRIGTAYDVHRLTAGDSLRLGGVKIECGLKVIAHSDGDVLLHALSEAILGALALGDLGTFFPPDERKTEGLDSAVILGFAIDRMAEQGYVINNIDISVITEAPRLKPYISRIRRKLSELICLSPELISVKANSNEQLDDIGAGKGIGCLASVLLRAEHQPDTDRQSA